LILPFFEQIVSTIKEIILKGTKSTETKYRIYHEAKTITLEYSRTNIFSYFLKPFYYCLLHLELSSCWNIIYVILEFFISTFFCDTYEILVRCFYSFDELFIDEKFDIYDIYKNLIK